MKIHAKNTVYLYWINIIAAISEILLCAFTYPVNIIKQIITLSSYIYY